MSRRERNYFLLYMFQQDVDLMTKWVLQYPNKETGGDLFGLWSGEGDNAVIHVVLGPGRNCTHGDYHFYQDVEYLRKVGSLLTQDYMLGHIGEWHSHHQLKLDRPSEGDCRTIDRNFPRGAFGFFLMIANIDRKNNVHLSPYVFKEGSRRGRAGQVGVIADRSPFAMVIRVSQKRNTGKEEEPSNTTEFMKDKGKETVKEKEGRKEKEITVFVPDYTTSLEMGSTTFSSTGLDGMQNSSFGLKDVDSRSTRMLKEYKMRLPEHSDFQWYSKEENYDLLQNILLGLHKLVVGDVKIYFEQHSKDLNMEFNSKGRKIRLKFASFFPISSVTLYVNDKFRKTFWLDTNFSIESHDLSKFLGKIADYIKI